MGMIQAQQIIELTAENKKLKSKLWWKEQMIEALTKEMAEAMDYIAKLNKPLPGESEPNKPVEKNED